MVHMLNKVYFFDMIVRYNIYMIITSHGAESIRIQFGDTIIAFNPISKASKLKSGQFGSDIALVSLRHPDMNGIENAGRGDKQPFVIKGPGEYEVKDVLIKGFPSVSHYGEIERINTIYTVVLEEMNIVYLGAIDTTELSSDIIESIDTVDILFVPIGGAGVLSASESYKLALKFEPSIIIPIHYGDIGEKDALKTFLKESGDETVKPTDKLTLKKKDVAGKESEVMILSSSV